MPPARHNPNTLRIIGGQWRGRRLDFPSLPGLRPTADRVRETLFNWLQPVIQGARCLDLFAGSGALGLEALSRGAEQVVMVDQNHEVMAQLRRDLILLHCTQAQLVQQDALAYLHAGKPPETNPFDIVFVDPPFHQGLLAPCCRQLESGGWLKPGAFIYLEAEHELSLTLPETWVLHRSKQAGQVGYHLAQRLVG